MPSFRDPSTLGDKLGPKIIAAVVQAVIATKKGLMPTEHKLRVASMQEIINVAGMEVAEHIGPFLLAAIDANPEMTPVIKDYLARTASGQHQLQAIAGHLAVSGASSVFGTLLSNELAPGAYSLIAANPHLRFDAQTAAAMNAADVLDDPSLLNEGNTQGFDNNRMRLLSELAQAVPDPVTVGQMLNRNLIDHRQAAFWIARGAYGKSIRDPLLELRHQILSVADAALAVLRNNITLTQGQAIAAENGMDAATFETVVLNTGEPPGLQQLLEAYRRGFIDQPRLVKGIRQSRVRDEWADVVEELRFVPLSAADAIEAYVKGYLTESEAQAKTEQAGLLPADFPVAALAAGEPLSRTEMADLVNRGEATVAEFEAAIRQSRVKDAYIPFATKLIQHPMTAVEAVRGFVQGYLTEAEADIIQAADGVRESDRAVQREIDGIPLSLTELLRLQRRGLLTQAEVEQGLRESRLKNKYIPAALELGLTLPSIFEIRLMLRDGALTDAQAATILREHGYAPDVITGIIHAFGSAGTAVGKSVTVGMLTDLYLESAITVEQYKAALTAEGYSPANVTLLVEVADWRIELAQRNAVIARTRTMYVNRHISSQVAQDTLNAEHVPSAVIDRVLADWNAELKGNIRLLSEAQIADAWQYSLFNATDSDVNTQLALAYLARIGYTAEDAHRLLVIKNKGQPIGGSSGNTV